MKQEMLRLFQLVALKGGPLADEAQQSLEQLLGIVCKRQPLDALARMACDILEQVRWEGAKSLYSEDGIWVVVPQQNGTEAFLEVMYWRDRLGNTFAGMAMGVLPLRFVYSRLYEADAVALVGEIVRPVAGEEPPRFRLFGSDEAENSLPAE